YDQPNPFCSFSELDSAYFSVNELTNRPGPGGFMPNRSASNGTDQIAGNHRHHPQGSHQEPFRARVPLLA
ncbi:MAG: hypothetical protein ACREDR_36020, partial [Blastocatellia bacterium]